MTTRSARAAALAAAVLVLALAACGGSSGKASAGASSAKAAGQSALANPAVSADVQAAEQLLLANLQKDFKASHPYSSAKQAVKDTFPAWLAGKIVTYGLHTFTLAVVHPLRGANPARDKWAQGVAAYALANGGGTASPGTAKIPGTTASPSPPTTGGTP